MLPYSLFYQLRNTVLNQLQLLDKVLRLEERLDYSAKVDALCIVNY